MEQTSLEHKVNNILNWLAYQVACIQIYNWDEESKKKHLNDAWQKVQEQFKKDIDWTALTESQCKALYFKSWQSEEDIEEEISYLQSELDKGHLTKEEFDERVADEYERVVRYVEEIKKGSKPSLWRRILFNLTRLCKWYKIKLHQNGKNCKQ